MKKRFVVFCSLIPVMISLLLIGAHFLRSGNVLVLIGSLFLIMALGVREPLVARTVQLALLLATAEWFHVAYGLVAARLASGQPWNKLVLIMGGVIVLSLASVALFLTKTLRERYHLDSGPGEKAQPGRTKADGPRTGLAPIGQVASAEHRRQLLAVYSLKGNLTTASLLAFLLMDFSVGFGVMALIAIGLINTALRTRMQRIGGRLAAADKRRLYVRQALGLCLFAVPIIGYYSLTLPVMKHRLIVDSIITAFTLLLWAAARYEYLYMEQEG